jgi:flagellar basal-body rod protein FlgG
MLSDITRQDVIASNLANVNTAGYKADRVVNETFSDLFLKNVNGNDATGHINLGTRVAGVVTDLHQGPLRNTGNNLDFAIGGDGFFAVQTQNGVRYTRDGEFTRTPSGQLVTSTGEFVLGQNGLPINVGVQGEIKADEQGRLYTDSGRAIGQLGLFTLDMQTAQKQGGDMWNGTPTNGGQAPAGSTLRQGFVEQSSVNSVQEMVEMISTLRNYESVQKAATAIDGTLDRAVNAVGVVNG